MADDSTLGLGLDNPQYQDLITKQQEAIKAANQPYGMNAGQGAIAAGLGLLPALIGGLVRGREGLAMGAQAGLAGVGSYDSILKENFDRQSKAEAANAALYGQQAQQLAQSALQDQRFMAQEGLRQQNRIALREMFPNKETNVTVNMPGTSMGLDKETRKDVSPYLKRYQTVSQAISGSKGVLQKYPELAELNYNNIDEGVNVAGKGAAAWLLGSETPLGKLYAEAKNAVAEYGQSVSGATISEQERERHEAILTGKGKLPVTPKMIIETLDNIRRKTAETAKLSAISGGLMAGRFGSLEEALSSPSVKGVEETIKFIDDGKYFLPQSTEQKTLTGPKGAFTVGTK